jgi:hypothetical protein
MAENPFGLRAATPVDAAALLAFVLPIYEEGAAQTVSPRKVASLVERCVLRDRAIAGIVVGAEGEIEASVGATIEEFDYSDEPHMMIKWLGVAPAFRNSDRAGRMVGYCRWLFETMSAGADNPVPVFMPTLTTAEQRSKVLMFQRRLPMVGMLYALGCLPSRSFFDPARVGRRQGGTRESIKAAANVPRPSLAQAG